MKSITVLTLGAYFLLTACNTKAKDESIKIPETITPKTETTSEIKTEKFTTDSLKTEANSALEATTEKIEEKKEVVETKITEKKETLKTSIKEKKQALPKAPKTEPTVTDVRETVIEEAPKEVKVATKPNHQIWNTLTKKYVSSNGKVNYNGFKSQLSTIENYLLHLQNTPPKSGWSKNEKLAYWFNLYNASTVHLVASNYPIKSIKDLAGGKPWDKKFIKSGDKTLSLNNIENTIVRPNYNEPRLHVAFNCAAVSCPNLSNEAFIPSKLNSQLSKLSRKWINDTSKNIISTDKIQISQIFDWYKADFKQGVIPFINTYNSNEKADANAEISYLKYDWKLND